MLLLKIEVDELKYKRFLNMMLLPHLCCNGVYVIHDCLELLSLHIISASFVTFLFQFIFSKFYFDVFWLTIVLENELWLCLLIQKYEISINSGSILKASLLDICCSKITSKLFIEYERNKLFVHFIKSKWCWNEFYFETNIIFCIRVCLFIRRLLTLTVNLEWCIYR